LSIEINFQPDNKKIEVKPETTILKAAMLANIHLSHKCGGRGACLTCKVKVEDQGTLSKPNMNEKNKLGSKIQEEGLRLGCQAKVIKDTIIYVPEDPLKAAIRRQLEAQKTNSWDD